MLNFYKISFKTSFSGKLKYGKGYYDFEEGGMSFIAPGQLLKMQDEEANYEGMTLHFHPDLLTHYALNASIKQYGYFSYAAAEALYLSEKEKITILGIYTFIRNELNERIDKFSQDVIISQIELLLNYANRFYDRQFLTRKVVNNDILSQLELQLQDYFNEDSLVITGLPTVKDIAQKMNVSPRT